MNTSPTFILLSILLYFIIGGFILVSRKVISKQAALAALVLSNVIGLYLVVTTHQINKEPLLLNFNWVELRDFKIVLSFYFENATWLMLGLVQLIALGVNVFSSEYMRDDPEINKYYGFLGIFTGSMLALVVSNNLFQFFAFWELVGFCSFLLIGFWYKKQKAYKAAGKAFIINKIGDALLLIAIGLYYAQSQSLLMHNMTEAHLWVGIFFILGSLAKSAQFPLQTWLPDAMEGPTPVSALIHAATMVAAGVFLLFRVHAVLGEIPLELITVIGAFTAIIAGLSAIFQWDIKKILAYSTVSQLGFMMLGIGIKLPNAAFFHLLTHAFFKAGLFLIAGALILYAHHKQDIREIRINKPFLAACFLVCSASLMGLPLFSGFLSKDAILLGTLDWQGPSLIKTVVVTLSFAASLCTPIYCAKIFSHVFSKEGEKIKGLSSMERVIFILSAGSLFYLFSRNPLELEGSYFATMLTLPTSHWHWVGYILSIISLAVFFVSYRIFSPNKKGETTASLPILEEHFYIDKFYQQQVVGLVIGHQKQQYNSEAVYDFEQHSLESKIEVEKSFTGHGGLAGIAQKIDDKVVDALVNKLAAFTEGFSQFNAWLDRNIVDGFISLVAKGVDNIGNKLRKIQSGKLQEYLIATIVILIFTLILASIL